HGAGRQHPVNGVGIEDLRLDTLRQTCRGVACGDDAINAPGRIGQRRQTRVHAPNPGRTAGLSLELAARERIHRTRTVWLERGGVLGYRTRSAKLERAYRALRALRKHAKRTAWKGGRVVNGSRL